MKNKKLVFTLLAATAFAMGCDKEPSASQQLEKVKSETKEAARDMKDYTYAQKGDFVKQMEAQLNALGQDLEKLSAKIERSSDSIKAEAKPKLQALRDQAGQLNVQLDKAKDATESTRADVKAGSRKAYDALTDGFNQARTWVSEKIAP